MYDLPPHSSLDPNHNSNGEDVPPPPTLPWTQAIIAMERIYCLPLHIPLDLGHNNSGVTFNDNMVSSQELLSISDSCPSTSKFRHSNYQLMKIALPYHHKSQPRTMKDKIGTTLATFDTIIEIDLDIQWKSGHKK